MATSFRGQQAAVALCCALASGAACAGITTGNNPSVTLIAINTATGAWYVRDTGFLMNAFLPNHVVPRIDDGPATGTITPTSDVPVDKTSVANFADASFSTWLAQQSSTQDVRWMISSADRVGASPTNVRRLITSSAAPGETLNPINGRVDNYTAGLNGAGRLNEMTGSFDLSATGFADLSLPLFSNFGLGVSTLAMLDTAASLYYVERSTHVGGTGFYASTTRYAYETRWASLTLESDGDLIYQPGDPLPPPPVPLPAAAWLLAAGLAAGASARRRRTPELAVKTP